MLRLKTRDKLPIHTARMIRRGNIFYERIEFAGKPQVVLCRGPINPGLNARSRLKIAQTVGHPVGFTRAHLFPGQL